MDRLKQCAKRRCRVYPEFEAFGRLPVMLMRLFLALFVSASCLMSGIELSASDFINKTSSGLALKGYDPVCYFTEGQPVKGRAEFSYEWMGAQWLFSTKANRDLFMKDPTRYAPQYGGF